MEQSQQIALILASYFKDNSQIIIQNKIKLNLLNKSFDYSLYENIENPFSRISDKKKYSLKISSINTTFSPIKLKSFYSKDMLGKKQNANIDVSPQTEFTYMNQLTPPKQENSSMNTLNCNNNEIINEEYDSFKSVINKLKLDGLEKIISSGKNTNSLNELNSIDYHYKNIKREMKDMIR